MVVLTNTEGAQASALETAIARAVLGLDAKEAREVPLGDEELARYTGTYDLTIMRVTVTGSESRLYAEVSVPGLEGSHTLLHVGDDTFVSEHDAGVEVTFTTDGGRASGFVLRHKGITMRGGGSTRSRKAMKRPRSTSPECRSWTIAAGDTPWPASWS